MVIIDTIKRHMKLEYILEVENGLKINGTTCIPDFNIFSLMALDSLTG